MSDEPKSKPVLSPFQRPGTPRPPHHHIEVQQHEFHRKNTFLTLLADLALMIIGWACVYVFSTYPPGSAADIAGTIALGAYIAAAVQAIRQHSEEYQVKEAKKELAQFIGNAIRDIKP